MPSITSSDIPTELWKQDMLCMPACLTTSYRSILEEYNMLKTALNTRDVRTPIGGLSREDTLLHFALRYGVSTSRVESLVLDPSSAFGTI